MIINTHAPTRAVMMAPFCRPFIGMGPDHIPPPGGPFKPGVPCPGVASGDAPPPPFVGSDPPPPGVNFWDDPAINANTGVDVVVGVRVAVGVGADVSVDVGVGVSINVGNEAVTVSDSIGVLARSDALNDIAACVVVVSANMPTIENASSATASAAIPTRSLLVMNYPQNRQKKCCSI
jgi:hypothetical protein